MLYSKEIQPVITMHKYFIILLGILSSCVVNHKEEHLKDRYLNRKIELKKINYSNKSLYFIGVRHIGTTNYYNQVKFKIDSLQPEGYNFLYEGNSLNKSNKTI